MVVEKKTDPRVNEVRGFYIAIFKKMFGFTPTVNYPKSGSVIKRMLKDFTEWQCYLFVCIHFEWRGMDGNDEFTHKRLKDRAFPLEWISFNVNSYQAYARNVLGLDFDDEIKLKEYINNYTKSI